jgi:hypothetical protein
LIVEGAAVSPLVAWESFYVIIGSSAAALTGLQFVVIALVGESRARTTSHEIAAFGTPTIVHFCAVLLMSAILSAPWRALSNAGLALDACGAAGMLYVVIVLRRARRQTGYAPVLEDWLWHAVFPFIAYTVLLGAAVALARDPAVALFVIGTTALLILFIGIHNAWDAVIYIAVERRQAPKEPEEKR